MNKLCYSWKSNVENTMRLSETGEVIMEKTKRITTISDFNIEQCIFLCFNRGCSLSTSTKLQDDTFVLNWFSFYSLAKFFFKTDDGNNCKLISSYILKSCQIAHESSPAKDPIIEPHYLLVNSCYKWIKQGIINVNEALALLSKDNQFFQEQEEFWINDEGLAGDYQKKVFFDKIMKLLHHLLSVDKKKWQHRPRYRIARILFDDFGDVDGALKEMDSLISAKSVNKNLVNIWKPDFERPGKHFIYTYQYLVLYLDLLFAMKDFNTTGLVIKKLRRFGSGTVNINELLERAISVYTQSAKIKLQLQDKSYVEQILPTLDYQNFLKISEQLNQAFDPSNHPEEITSGLKLAFQLKKGHSGIAFDSVCPVSYTHLDVYKRQGFNSAKLERLISEYEFTKEENLSLLLGRHRKFILSDLTQMMNNYIDLTNNLLVPDLSDKTIFERYHLDKYKGIKPEGLSLIHI